LISEANPPVDLIIVGASTRAAAFSAIRAGFRPVCFDAFADVDLCANALVEPLPDDPGALEAALNRWPELPVMYTGGLENRPDFLSVIAASHALWGNPAEVVAAVRDPFRLVEPARLSRIGFPEITGAESPPIADGSWLLRARAGAGGRGILPWTEDNRGSELLREPHYFQKRIAGESHSALFLAEREIGDVRFLGLTRQLIGLPESHADEFQWCGNIGPVTLPVPVEAVIRRFGNVLKWKFGLVGLFGVDLIISPEGDPWVTEVNPRYPASIELFEHSLGIPLLADHARCFVPGGIADSGWKRCHPGSYLGKGILYSPVQRTLTFPLGDARTVPVDQFPGSADLPQPGTLLVPGTPVCTVFSEAPTIDGTLSRLKEKLQSVSARIRADSEV